MSDVLDQRWGGGFRLGIVPGAQARGALVAAILLGGILGLVWPAGALGGHVAAALGPALVRLLRAMALLKGALVVVAGALVYWRLGAGVGVGRLAAYGLAAWLMSVGPGLIWGLAHIGLGAVLLHGGLGAVIVLLWRDPGMAVSLERAITARRAALR